MQPQAQARWSRPAISLIGALVGGVVGFLIGVSVIDWMDQAPLDLTLEMLIAMCIAGGWGWIIGLTLGWFGSLGRQGPSKVGRTVGIMLALAVGFLWFGLFSMRCARYGSFGPMIDDISAHDPLRDRLAQCVAVDTAIGVVSLILLAAFAVVRGGRRASSDGRSPDHDENS